MFNLDPSQEKAVLTMNCPVMVIAGPGSGKTRTLTYRIKHLLHAGVSPNHILALTFTNKASDEMKKRLENLSSSSQKLPFIGTIHSFALKTLNESLGSEINLIDEFEQLTIIKELKLKVKIPLSAKKLSRLINLDKIGKEKIPNDINSFYQEYNSYLQENNLFDYADLLLKLADLLKKDAQLTKTLQTKYHHVLVDEYQDINDIQDEIIRTLAKPQNNLFVIGDADQAIYGFRGADLNIFLGFENYFPSVKQIQLGTNYRSTKSIVNAASSLIEHNKKRIPNRLSSKNNKESFIQIIKCRSEQDEARFIAKKIEDMLGGISFTYKDSNSSQDGEENEEYNFSDFVILYRTNDFPKQIEEALIKQGIPRQCIGNKTFWQQEEIRDSISLIKSSDISNNHVNEKAAILIEKELNKKYKEDTDALSNLCRCIEIIRNTEATAIQDLLSQLKLRFRETYIDKRASCVTLMTLHQSKGLEFKVVFIAGVEEGLIPLLKNQDLDALEEERRLFYVGMTRAMNHLYLTHAYQRMIWGKRVNQKPSRFIKDIGDENIRKIKSQHHKKKQMKEQMKLFK